MKKLITLILILLFCSCSASLSVGKQGINGVTPEQFNAVIKQIDAALGVVVKRLEVLEPKKVEEKK